jgi:hypothetical protein
MPKWMRTYCPVCHEPSLIPEESIPEEIREKIARPGQEILLEWADQASEKREEIERWLAEQDDEQPIDS